MDSVGAAMQNAMASVDPNLPFSGFYGMNDLMAETLAIQRLEVALLVTMAIARVIAERCRHLRSGR